MRRVLVYTPDLLFYSQVKGTADACGWIPVHLKVPAMPTDGVSGDCVVVDACRDLEAAWKVLDLAREACPWLVLACHQHKSMEVAEEALRRGATEAVRRGAFLTRLMEWLKGSAPDPKAPFVGAPPS